MILASAECKPSFSIHPEQYHFQLFLRNLQGRSRRRDFEALILQLQTAAGKFVSEECVVAARKYKCGVAFPECDPSGDVADRPPCGSVCSTMCSACRIVPCLCYHMNDPSSGDSACMKEGKFESWLWGVQTLDISLAAASSKSAKISLAIAMLGIFMGTTLAAAV